MVLVDKHVPHLDDNRVFYLRMKCVLKKNGIRTKQSGFVVSLFLMQEYALFACTGAEGQFGWVLNPFGNLKFTKFTYNYQK